MSGRIGGVVGQAIKVAAVVTGVLAVDPWVEQVFPDLPAAARYAASALPEAVLVEVLAQLVFGWPRIAVRWSEHSESTPVSSVTLRASRRTMTAQSMDVTIDAATSGTVGHWLFRRWMRDDVILRFMADEAPIRPTVERSSKRNDIASVRPVDQTRGFDAVLGVAPRRPGTWHDAEVRWAVVDFPAPDTEFNFDHRLVVPGRPIRTWLLKCIRVSTSADTIRIVRK